ncbi:hypothetical protein [Streptomyces zaomyceticus]|uniref:hypothetical protein n=1 Tax=Streptomyces zaomyceticus TaxID=68286 RepID=UPI0036B708AD
MKAVTSLTVEPARDDSGWIAYADTALIAYRDGEVQTLNIYGTTLSAALEEHADDEAELGTVPTVVIPFTLPEVASNGLGRCQEPPEPASKAPDAGGRAARRWQ